MTIRHRSKESETAAGLSGHQEGTSVISSPGGGREGGDGDIETEFYLLHIYNTHYISAIRKYI